MSRETYMHDGRKWRHHVCSGPVNCTLAYAGLHRAGAFRRLWRGGGAAHLILPVIEPRLKGAVEEFRANLQDLDRRAIVPFNRKAEWGADGRIMPHAPVYSPFIRRKQHLDLE